MVLVYGSKLASHFAKFNHKHWNYRHLSNFCCKLSSTMANLNQFLKELKIETARPKPDLKKCENLMAQLKLGLLTASYMPTDNKAQPAEIAFAREVLELGVEISVLMENIPAFERYMSQLKCYYYDYSKQVPESPNMYKLLGLNLLFLLSQNRVAEFHTELELLPCEKIRSNQFIAHPLSLEQYLMEGRYNKLFVTKGKAPAECYNFFTEILFQTVRNEIGACIEKSYGSISVTEAAKRLNLASKEEVLKFGKERGWRQNSDGSFNFTSDAPKTKEPIPNAELAEIAITYARELEMIV